MADKKKINNIDEYINEFPKDVQIKLQELRKVIKDTAPESIETISWQMPTFKLNGNLVHFAAFTKHIGLYPGPEAIVKFEKELMEYKTSKGAIQFPLDKPIPFDLIKRIVEFRVKEQIKNMKK